MPGSAKINAYMYTCKPYFSKKVKGVLEYFVLCIRTSWYYNIQKIRQYQKLVLRYDYTTGILLSQKGFLPWNFQLCSVMLTIDVIVRSSFSPSVREYCLSLRYVASQLRVNFLQVLLVYSRVATNIFYHSNISAVSDYTIECCYSMTNADF